MEDLPSTECLPPLSPRPSSPLSGEDYTEYHHDIVLGTRVRPRRRKAVRRSKSALDARPKLRLSEIDPREPPVPRVDVRTTPRPPWTGRPKTRGRGRARMSLPENRYLSDNDRGVGLHQVSPEPEGLVGSSSSGGGFASPPPFHSCVLVNRSQHSSSVSPDGSVSLSPTATAPTSDSSDRDQKSSIADVPHVQFKLKKSRTANKKSEVKSSGSGSGGSSNGQKATNGESTKKTKAMLNEPLSSDTGGEPEDNNVNISKASTLEARDRPRVSVASSQSSTSPTLTPSTSRCATPSTVPKSLPHDSKTSLSDQELPADDAIVFALSDDSSLSSPKPQTSRPYHLDLAGDMSPPPKVEKPTGSVSFDETLNTKCELDTTEPVSKLTSPPRAKGKSKRFKLPSLFKKSEEKEGASSLPQSQQSSVVGLDWLFSTDSDSPSSGNVTVRDITDCLDNFSEAAHVLGKPCVYRELDIV